MDIVNLDGVAGMADRSEEIERVVRGVLKDPRNLRTVIIEMGGGSAAGRYTLAIPDATPNEREVVRKALSDRLSDIPIHFD